MTDDSKQAYSEPALVCYGSITKLTRGGGSGGGDGLGGGSGAPIVMIMLMAKLPTTE